MSRRLWQCAGWILRAWSAAAALLPLAALGADERCEPMLEHAPALLELSIQLHGSQVETRLLPALQAAQAILLVRERGIDVVLAVKDSAGRIVGRADNPIRRTGIQRIVLPTSGSNYVAEVTGKAQEPAGVGGLVELRLVGLTSPPGDSICIELQRALAAADAAYAEGQSRSLEGSGESSGSAAESYKVAANSYERAATRSAQASAGQLAAQSQHAAAAALYQDVQDWESAFEWAQRADAAYSTLSLAYERARAAAIAAAALMEMDGSETRSPVISADTALVRARHMLGEIAAFHAKRGEAYEEALALNNIGLTYYLQDAFEKAIQVFQRALPLFEKSGETFRRSLTLQNVALSEVELGRIPEARAHYAQALRNISRRDNPKVFALIANNQALCDRLSGRPDAALREYAEALSTAKGSQDAYAEGVSLEGIAGVYDALGDHDLALDFYRQALALHGSKLDVRGRVIALRSIADILRERGDATAALRMHQEALALASAPSMKARITLQLVRDNEALRDDRAALKLVESLPDIAASDNELRARALLERARLRERAGESARAETDVRQALEAALRADSLLDEFQSWVTLAGFMRARGLTAQALSMLDRALKVAEGIRLQSANPELRATLLQPLRPATDMVVSLLAHQYFESATESKSRAGIAMRALMAAEQTRARALADLQNLEMSAPGVPADLARERESVYRTLAAEHAQLEASIEESGPGSRRVEALRAKIAVLRESAHQIDAQIAAAVGAPAAHGKRRGGLDLSLIPNDMAIIEYWLGAEEAYAWVLTRTGVELFTLGSSRPINEAALAFHTALRGFGSVPRSERISLAVRLYELVLAPLGERALERKTLVFAADGALHYIPFAALAKRDGSGVSFLVTRDTAVTPSAALLLQGRRRYEAPPDPPRMLLVADPVYTADDPRIVAAAPGSTSTAAAPLPVLRGAQASGRLARLTGTAQEARTIESLLNPQTVDQLEGFDATRDNLLGADLQRYRHVHIGSHAISDSEIPQLSAFILSTVDRQGRPIEGHVFAADLMSKHFRADTVVLSGCDTALGKNLLGEGLIGLRYVVLARGARSVVASLWQVPDQPAARLISRFYGAMLREHESVPRALADAMRAAQLEHGYTDPALWAAFTATIGDLDWYPINSTTSGDTPPVTSGGPEHGKARLGTNLDHRGGD
jgi:CHAT domain-containing protein/tetratricopeptide (TPR) repeat protein